MFQRPRKFENWNEKLRIAVVEYENYLVWNSSLLCGKIALLLCAWFTRNIKS